ncbi:MAG TPA: helix-hairpin-helix domain-containing protein, partial [Anaerolineae bacterium]|nr:helix-hairpin-helix domain-containing protein [Anaerolineae bacterium]
MDYIFWIIVGVIIGWIIEWVIDWLFWRRPDGQALEKLALAENENRRLQAQLGDAEATAEQLRTELNAVAGQAPQEEDVLERIKGLSSSFAQRLHEAGIFTFAQLAESNSDRVRQVANPAEWQNVDPDSWVAQARDFADEKAGASQRILMEYHEREQLQEKLAQLEAENGRLQVLAAGSAGLAVAEHEAESRAVSAGEADLTLAAVRPALDVQPDVTPTRRDRLEAIEGVGPAYAKKLNEAGIFSFWQLGEQTPERVHEIINPKDWQKIEPESWIDQARAMADPDQLEDIVGIGRVFAQRLNDAGIYTFAQLAELTPERVEEIVEVEEPQKIDADGWIAQAKGFAFKKAQHTRALGSRARQMPRDEDPLESIEGIGPVYAKRLNEA